MPASPAANGRSDKSKVKTKIIVLKLAPTLLRQFAPKVEAKSESTSSASPANAAEEPSLLKPTLPTDAASDSNSTPAPGQDASAFSDSTKKRKAPGGPRKSMNTGIDTMAKPRGKPGPKKKPRLEDGTIDHSTRQNLGVAAAHKLGPKANTGAINAGLRALDRTGTPCRKWAKRGFQLKSFTGIMWEIPSWKGGEKSALSRDKDTDSTSDNKDVSMQSSSDAKPNGSDVAMSNVGDQPDAMAISTPAASSPAPMLASAAIAAHG